MYIFIYCRHEHQESSSDSDTTIPSVFKCKGISYHQTSPSHSSFQEILMSMLSPTGSEDTSRNMKLKLTINGQ